MHKEKNKTECKSTVQEMNCNVHVCHCLSAQFVNCKEVDRDRHEPV